MTAVEVVVLLVAGIAAGLINCVSSGGSFFTYPALVAIGLSPIDAAASTLAALTPANLAAIPEYWPEVEANLDRYRATVTTVAAGSAVGIALLFAVGADGFEVLVPWLVLAATLLFAVSPALRDWATANARSVTDGSAGLLIVFLLAVYLTFFGSGVGNLFLAVFIVRGFGDFLAANVAKNVVMSLGTVMATVAYSVAGYVQWPQVLPILVGSAIGGRFGSRVARRIPIGWLRIFVISFGVFVAIWLFARQA